MSGGSGGSRPVPAAEIGSYELRFDTAGGGWLLHEGMGLMAAAGYGPHLRRGAHDVLHRHTAPPTPRTDGVSDALARRAAEHGMDILALTDRDGLYGAIKHAQACADADLPGVGVNFASPTRTPTRLRPSSGPSSGSGLGPRPSSGPGSARSWSRSTGSRLAAAADRAALRTGSRCWPVRAAGPAWSAWSRPRTTRASAASRG